MNDTFDGRELQGGGCKYVINAATGWSAEMLSSLFVPQVAALHLLACVHRQIAGVPGGGNIS